MAGVVSLSPLREELDNTVDNIVHRLEQFTEDSNNLSLLTEPAQALEQVLGIARMTELNGAALLLTELGYLAEQPAGRQ